MEDSGLYVFRVKSMATQEKDIFYVKKEDLDKCIEYCENRKIRYSEEYDHYKLYITSYEHFKGFQESDYYSSIRKLINELYKEKLQKKINQDHPRV